jgi:hypothetical protein
MQTSFMVLINSFVRDMVEMMTAGNKSRRAFQRSGSASVVTGNTTVEVAAHLPLMVAVVVAVIVSIIILLAGSG